MTEKPNFTKNQFFGLGASNSLLIRVKPKSKEAKLFIEGKIVVDNDIEKIAELNKRAEDLNMTGVKTLERNEILDLEPNCKFKSALYVPQAGVVDYKVVTEAIAKKFISLGGTVEYFQKIKTINSLNDLKVLTSDKETFTSKYLIKLKQFNQITPNHQITKSKQNTQVILISTSDLTYHSFLEKYTKY